MAKTNKEQAENIKECTYYVRGMHCASCELIIEKKLLKNKNVESVEASASLKDGQVVIFYEGKKPSLEKLNKEFKGNGYTFSPEPFIERKETPFISLSNNGQFLVNKKKLFRNIQIIGLAFLLLIGFMFLSRSGLASRLVVSSNSALSAFFLFGLLAGASSCAALVGGLILSMSKQWSEVYLKQNSPWQKFQPHLLFNLGRLIAFALLGAYLGIIGARLQTSLMTTSLLAVGVSIMMILLALQMLGVKRFQKFQITVPKSVSRFVADETHFKGRWMPFILGALTFFLPCGFTITAQGLAITSGSGLQASLIMLFFALGTLPMLMAIGFSSFKLTAKPHLSAKFIKIAGVLVLFFGLYNFNSQLNVLGLPSLDDIKFNSSRTIRASEGGLAPMINGRQVLKMNALAYGYEPNEFKVKAGVPVRWEINNEGVSGCTNAIVSKGLFDGQISLDKDFNVKEFVPQKTGRYKFSCWMGMISGAITVVGEDGSSGGVVNQNRGQAPLEEIPSGASGCEGGNDSGCGGGCGGGCGNPGCPFAR